MATLLCSAATVSMAEIGYVTDSLRLGVHEAQDTSDQAFTYLESGDRVEILERTPFYAKVTIPDGRNGWVRVTYLVDEEPAKRRVAQLERERDALVTDLDALKSDLTARESKLSGLEEQAASSVARTRSEQAELQQLRKAQEEADRELAKYRFSVPGSWAIGAMLAGLLAGFLVGWWWIDRRSRQRHGGFRIY